MTMRHLIPVSIVATLAAAAVVAARPAASTTAIPGDSAEAAGRRAPSVVDERALEAIDATVEAGIRRGIYPGAVVIVGRGDEILHARGYGRLTWKAGSAVPSPDSTLWDIASLTKVVGTAGVAARLVDRGILDLDAPVSRFLPRFQGGGKERVTVRMLLDHTSGLKSYIPFFKRVKTREQALDLLFAEPLKRVPGDSAVYSDLNAVLLGMVLERAGGLSLDSLVAREVTGPLGMSDTRFRPERALHPRIAPTGVYRGTPMVGLVNDANAALLGGVAGHAGLFATGRDLARYAQTWLRLGAGDGARTADTAGAWVRPSTVGRFLSVNASAGTRLLGWDTRDTLLVDGPSVFGSLVSQATYGHTGWTGTELWMDPSHDLFLVFLTNRSFDPRVAESIKELRTVRAEVSDAVVRLVAR